MSWRGFFFVFVVAVLTMGANLLFRIGIQRGQETLVDSAPVFSQYLSWLLQPAFIAGVFFYSAAALVWVLVVASEPLSIAYPILVGMTFVLVVAGAVSLLGENFDHLKLFGCVMICLGIIVISKSNG